MTATSAALIALPPVRSSTDPLVGFVFLFNERALRGDATKLEDLEVARVTDVVVRADAPYCVCETTAGPLTLLRETVAVMFHRERGVYHPWRA